MLDYAREAVDLASSRRRTDLDTDRIFRFAMTHLVEIVGEAASRVSQAFRADHQGIPWKGIVGLRNRLIHGYSEVDLDILWDIMDSDLPALIAELQRVLEP